MSTFVDTSCSDHVFPQQCGIVDEFLQEVVSNYSTYLARSRSLMLLISVAYAEFLTDMFH